MSGRRVIITAGYPMTATDGQRLADVAASAGDAQLSALVDTGGKSGGSGSPNKRYVIPLLASGDAEFVDGIENDASANALMTTLVSVAVLNPCAVVVRGVGTANVPDLIAVTTTQKFSGVFASNASGGTRADLVYAAITRTVALTGARKVKNTTTGVKSTQTIDLASDATVALGIVTGVGPSTTIAALPADGAGTYYVPLALVDIPNGYTSGGGLTRSWLRSVWPRGWVNPKHVRAHGRATINEAGGGSTTVIPQRWGSLVRFAGVVKHASNPQTFTLDALRDWRSRAAQVRLLRASASAGHYLAPHLVTANDKTTNRSIDTGLQFTGTGGTFYSSGGTPMAFTLAVNAGTYALELTISAAPDDALAGDHYFLTVDGCDQFVSG